MIDLREYRKRLLNRLEMLKLKLLLLQHLLNLLSKRNTMKLDFRYRHINCQNVTSALSVYLQIRVPGSNPITNTFEATATLADVYSYLQTQGCDNPFSLSTTFPRKTFGSEDQAKTLKDLSKFLKYLMCACCINNCIDLVPSAALVLAYL